MLPTDIVEEPDQDPVLSNSPTRCDLEDGPDTHYIEPSFCNELKKIVDFEVKSSFKRNYRVGIPSPSDTIDNPLPICVVVYIEALEHGLQFSLPTVVMEIFRTYDLAIAQLVPNAWALILLFVATCKFKRFECTALAFTYVHTIQ